MSAGMMSETEGLVSGMQGSQILAALFHFQVGGV